MNQVTCEIHRGAVCYQGGKSGTMWKCPACEIETNQANMGELAGLRTRVTHLESTVNALFHALRSGGTYADFADVMQAECEELQR